MCAQVAPSDECLQGYGPVAVMWPFVLTAYAHAKPSLLVYLACVPVPVSAVLRGSLLYVWMCLCSWALWLNWIKAAYYYYITAQSRLIFSTAQCISDGKFATSIFGIPPQPPSQKITDLKLKLYVPYLAITTHLIFPDHKRLGHVHHKLSKPLPFSMQHQGCDDCLEVK